MDKEIPLLFVYQLFFRFQNLLGRLFWSAGLCYVRSYPNLIGLANSLQLYYHHVSTSTCNVYSPHTRKLLNTHSYYIWTHKHLNTFSVGGYALQMFVYVQVILQFLFILTPHE